MADDTIKDDDILDCSPLSSFNVDTIDVSTTIGAQGSTYSYSTTPWSGNVTISTTAGSNGSSWYTTPYTINSIGSLGIGTTQPDLTVKGGANFESDVTIKGRSILKTLDKIEERLAIIQDPDPAKLEKFAALKKAYEHYKLIEKLIGDD